MASTPDYGTLVGTFDFANYSLITPTPDSTGVDRRTDIVVQCPALTPDPAQFPGSVYLYPHLPSLRTANMLKVYPDLSNTTAADGYGILYTTADDSPTGTLVSSFPCSIEFERGWGLDEARESAGRAVRFRLNPYPGGVNNAELPGGKTIHVRLAQTLPGTKVDY